MLLPPCNNCSLTSARGSVTLLFTLLPTVPENPLMHFLRSHYQTEGPLGFPMTDRQAKNLELLLKTLPKSQEFEYKHTTFHKAATEVNPGERSDVSWISTETPDRYNHVVFAKGMNDSQFKQNPIVTLNHNYEMPPVGRSLWRKTAKSGGNTAGVKAKTVYPQRPEGWGDDPWAPDKVFTLIQAGLLNGKSIGWLPTKGHFADSKESTKNGWPDGALIIEEWLLIEYAVGSIPVNPETVVEIVSKAAPDPDMCKALGWDQDLFKVSPKKEEKGPIPFTTAQELARAMEARVQGIDIAALVQEVFDKKRGRV
jgi:hypothetical protein